MRHRKAGRRLGRNSAHRKAMYRNMVTSLMVHGQIQTTKQEQGTVRADKVITMGKRVPRRPWRASPVRRSRPHKHVGCTSSVGPADGWPKHERLFGEYAERYKLRPGGYTRIRKVGFRSGDQAPMALIELVGDYDPSEAKVEAPGRPHPQPPRLKSQAPRRPPLRLRGQGAAAEEAAAEETYFSCGSMLEE